MQHPVGGYADLESGIRALLSPAWTESQVQALTDHLTVGETYFLREMRGLEILEEHVLPPLIRDRHGASQELKVWSAGCATGEEPYSVAILLSRLVPEWSQGSVRILCEGDIRFFATMKLWEWPD